MVAVLMSGQEIRERDDRELALESRIAALETALAAARAENERLRESMRFACNCISGDSPTDARDRLCSELRARSDDGRVVRAAAAVMKWFLSHGYIQLAANEVSCAGIAHDAIAAADGDKGGA